MNSILRKDYVTVYEPIWKKFIEELQGVNVDNCPLPHLPMYGKSYETSKYKIAFVGIDTIGSCDFHKSFNDNVDEIINKWSYDFNDDLLFLKWAQSYNFWKFIFQFLSKFYNVDLKKLKEGKEQNIKEILKSFIWGNVHSIERFHITAKKKGVEAENWKKVKNASLVFDKANNILHVFKPSVMIVTYWHAPEKWFTEGFKEFKGPEKFDNLWYYFIKDTNTHIFWTKHPQYLYRSGISDSVIDKILQLIISKNVFPSFPGKTSYNI